MATGSPSIRTSTVRIETLRSWVSVHTSCAQISDSSGEGSADSPVRSTIADWPSTVTVAAQLGAGQRVLDARRPGAPTARRAAAARARWAAPHR